MRKNGHKGKTLQIGTDTCGTGASDKQRMDYMPTPQAQASQFSELRNRPMRNLENPMAFACKEYQA